MRELAMRELATEAEVVLAQGGVGAVKSNGSPALA